MLFKEKVEFLCRQLCEEMGLDPDGNPPQLHVGWTAYSMMIEDWLTTEAFSKIRGKYWNDKVIEEERAKKQLIVMETERDNKV